MKNLEAHNRETGKQRACSDSARQGVQPRRPHPVGDLGWWNETPLSHSQFYPAVARPVGVHSTLSRFSIPQFTFLILQPLSPRPARWAGHALPPRQRGQTNPSGQRRPTRYSRQAWSVPKRRSNSSKVLGKSSFMPLRTTRWGRWSQGDSPEKTKVVHV